MTRRPPEPEQTTLVSALVGTLDAGQRLLSDRMDLIRMDAQATLELGLSRAIWLLSATLALSIGWVAALAALVLLLRPWVPAGLTFAAIGAAHVGGGLWLASRFRRLAAARTSEAGPPAREGEA